MSLYSTLNMSSLRDYSRDCFLLTHLGVLKNFSHSFLHFLADYKWQCWQNVGCHLTGGRSLDRGHFREWKQTWSWSQRGRLSWEINRKIYTFWKKKQRTKHRWIVVEGHISSIERDLEMNYLEPIASPLQFTVMFLPWHHKDWALYTGLKPCNSSGKYFLTTCYVLQHESALATRTGRRVYTFLGRLWEQTRGTYSASLSPEVALANRDYGTAHWEHTLPTLVLSVWCYQVKLSFFFFLSPSPQTECPTPFS